MKKTLVTILPFLAFALIACKSVKQSENVTVSADSSVTDTLSVAEQFNAVSASLSAGALEVSANCLLRHIDFVDSGGEVRVDSSGTMTVSGVRSAEMSLLSYSSHERDLETQNQSALTVSQHQARYVEDTTLSIVSQKEETPVVQPKSLCGWRMLVVSIVVILIIILLWRKLKR